MSQGSLNQKIWFLGQKLCPVARSHTDTQTRKWIQRTHFQGFRIFSYNLSSRIDQIIPPLSFPFSLPLSCSLFSRNIHVLSIYDNPVSRKRTSKASISLTSMERRDIYAMALWLIHPTVELWSVQHLLITDGNCRKWKDEKCQRKYEPINNKQKVELQRIAPGKNDIWKGHMHKCIWSFGRGF